MGLPNLLSTPIHPGHTPDFLSSGHFIPLFAGPLLTLLHSIPEKYLLYPDLRVLYLLVTHYVIAVRTSLNPVVLNFGCTLG